MREKLNDNPMAQIALVGVLLVVAAVFLLGKMGGGESEEEEASSPAAEAAVTAVANELEAGQQPVRLPAPGSGLGAVPPPPRAVVDAVDAGDVVAILFVRDGGIDDRLVREAVGRLESFSGVATFVVPAHKLFRWVSISQGVDLSRVPALVVIRPENLSRQYDPASVHYGFQSAQAVVQTVADARYHGGTLPYHP